VSQTKSKKSETKNSCDTLMSYRGLAVISVSYGKRLRNKTQLNSASRKETETQEKRHRGNGFDDAEKETERKKHHQISSRFHG